MNKKIICGLLALFVTINASICCFAAGESTVSEATSATSEENSSSATEENTTPKVDENSSSTTEENTTPKVDENSSSTTEENAPPTVDQNSSTSEETTSSSSEEDTDPRGAIPMVTSAGSGGMYSYKFPHEEGEEGTVTFTSARELAKSAKESGTMEGTVKPAGDEISTYTLTRLSPVPSDYYPVVCIKASFYNNGYYFEKVGTGTMVGRYGILTAGHVVYDLDTDKWASDITIYPRADYGDFPIGIYDNSHVFELNAGGDYVNNHDVDDDWGLIQLETGSLASELGYFGYDYTNNISNLVGDYTDVVGYRPYDVPANQDATEYDMEMVRSKGEIRSQAQHQRSLQGFIITNDAEPHMSGSPVMNSDGYVMGILTKGNMDSVEGIFCVAINGWLFDTITDLAR